MLIKQNTHTHTHTHTNSNTKEVNLGQGKHSIPHCVSPAADFYPLPGGS